MFTKKRPDGTYIRNLHFFTQLMPYLLPTRTEACIFFEEEYDVTKTIEYVRKRKFIHMGTRKRNSKNPFVAYSLEAMIYAIGYPVSTQMAVHIKASSIERHITFKYVGSNARA